MKTKNILIGISVLTLLSGCIRDDLSKCPKGDRHICFESVMKKYDFRDIVDHTTLYLYDTENTMVFNRTYTVEDLVSNDYRINIPKQKDGTYTLVASMNSGNDYKKETPSELSGFGISLIADAGKHVTRKQRDIYHGTRQIVYNDKEDQDKEICDLVRLYKNTNHIHVTVRYNGYRLPESHTLQASITADNGAYEHRNQNTKNNDRTYIPHIQESSLEREYYSFTVMHITTKNTISLLLNEQTANGNADAFLNMNLLREIMKIYPTDEDLDQEDIFYIDIVLGESMVVIELRINGWYAIRDGVDV